MDENKDINNEDENIRQVNIQIMDCSVNLLRGYAEDTMVFLIGQALGILELYKEKDDKRPEYN